MPFRHCRNNSPFFVGHKVQKSIKQNATPHRPTVHGLYYTGYKPKCLLSQASLSCDISAHLRGGGLDESRHRNDSTELIRNIKTYTIQTMIDQGSDIILGDFNSDQLETNAVFLRQSGWSDEQIQLWNSVPYKLLIANGYALGTRENWKTSVHGGFVDSIWYRGVELIDTGVIDLITGGWSDHNAVYATLMYLMKFRGEGTTTRVNTHNHRRTHHIQHLKEHKQAHSTQPETCTAPWVSHPPASPSWATGCCRIWTKGGLQIGPQHQPTEDQPTTGVRFNCQLGVCFP